MSAATVVPHLLAAAVAALAHLRAETTMIVTTTAVAAHARPLHAAARPPLMTATATVTGAMIVTGTTTAAPQRTDMVIVGETIGTTGIE